MRISALLSAILMALFIAGLDQAQGAQVRWTGATDGKWTTAANWNPIDASLSGDALIWDAASTANTISTNDYANLSVATLNLTNAPDGVVLNGSNLTVTATTPIIGVAGFGSATINMDLSLAATAILDNNVSMTFNGVISGAAVSLTSRDGNFALNAMNTFPGNVVLGTGGGVGSTIINTLTNTGIAQPLGTGNLVQFGNANSSSIRGNLVYCGKTTSTDKGFQIGGTNTITYGSGGVFANGSGSLTWTGYQILAPTVAVYTRAFVLGGFNDDDNTWQSAISNNPSGVSLTKDGAGKWILKGANEFTNGITISAGTLVLDYADTATVLNPGNKPVMSGGTLELKGNATGSTAQTLSNVTVTAATGLSTIRLNKNGGDGITLTLGTLVPSTTATLLFDLGAPDNSISTVTSLPLLSNRHCLIKDGNGRVDFINNTGAGTAIFAVDSTTDLPASPANSHYRLTGDLTLTGSLSVKTVRIAPSANNKTLTITKVGTFTNAPFDAILFVGPYDFTITQSAGQTGALGTSHAASSAALINHFGTGKLTLDTKLAGDSSSSGYGVVEFNGTGLIDWTRPANSTSNCIIAGVTLRQGGTTGQKLDSTSSGLGSGNIILASGGILEISDATVMTRNVGTGAGAIQWVGDGGGFSAFGGERTVNLGGAGATLNWGTDTGFVPNNNALVLSSPHADSTVVFQNGLNFGGYQRLVRVHDGSAAVDARLSGVLSSALGGGLVKDGDGTLELTGNNTYNGATWVKAGELRVNSSTGTGVQGTPDGGLVTVFNGASISGTGTVNHLTLNTGAKLVVRDIGAGVPGKLTVSGELDITNGTLDLSGLGTVAGGDQTIAEFGSLTGTQFASVVNPTGRPLQYNATTITLRGSVGTVVTIR